MKKKILYLDDMKNNLIGFEMQMEESFDVISIQDPEAALNVLQTIDPCIIVSDQKMPKMNGTEFFSKTLPIQPYAVRVLLTGKSEEELIIAAIRTAKIHDYIRKPCTEGELQERMKAAALQLELNLKGIAPYQQKS